MLTTLFALVALTATPGQPGMLALNDVRMTLGPLGPARSDAKVLPGDSLVITFDIDGITTDAQGKILYSVSTEVADKSNKIHFSQPAHNFEALNALGGNRLPAYALVDIGVEQPAGSYTVKVTVTDRANKRSATLTQAFEVLPRGFGMVRLSMTSDPQGFLPVPLLGTGQSIWVNAVVVGFGRDNTQKQPHLDLEMRVLDEKGKPTMAKPFAGTVDKDVSANANGVPIQFLLTLNRPGKFTVELKATCQVTKKSLTQSIPINVLASK